MSMLAADQLSFTRRELFIVVFKLFHNELSSEYFDGRVRVRLQK